MEYILIYSDKCNFSNQLKQYNIFNKVSKIVVNNKKDLTKIPEYVKEVPVLIIKNTIKKEINILKKNNLFEWFVSNSRNNNVADNNSHNKQTSNDDTNMLECNMLNTNFSNSFSFVGSDDNTAVDYAENFYSNYDNMGSDINKNNNNTNNNNNNNNNNIIGGIETREKKSLDNAYDKLLAERDNEFKGIQRV